jgi:hypothetical protein
MLVVGWCLSTPLAAQERHASWLVGLAATVGSSWQFEGADLGLKRPVSLGPIRHLSMVGRFGAFQDEGSFVFGSRGFVAGVALGAQSGMLPLFDVGTEQNPYRFALDLTLEASGYLASNSPFPQGSSWVGLAVLPGLRSLSSDNLGVAVMVGPVAFIGRETDVRAFLGVRLEVPLARGQPAP